MSKAKLSVEEAMQRLEEITLKMEEEALPLADMMALYKEGKKLQEQCKKQLDLAEKEILMLDQAESEDEADV
jgi:exodeoxyribonuclease VII small subunit